MRSIVPLAIALATFGAAASVSAQQLGQSSAQHANANSQMPIETNEDLQPDTLPTLPPGMTLDMIRQGDSIFHGVGGCFACHGSEGQGLPAAGDAITVSFNYVPYKWEAIDSLVTAGIPDALTRSPIAMPSRGGKGNLTDDQIKRVAAYVWAISQTKGEPWPGGHRDHIHMVPLGATAGTAPSHFSPSHEKRARGPGHGHR